MLIREGVSGILAGLCITLGGSVFLACDNKYVGALFFSVALLTICYFGFSLYTGRIGYLVIHHTRRDVGALLSGLLGNVLGCLGFGLLHRVAFPALSDKAAALCAVKLSESVPEALIRAFFCGVLMYIAVWIFKSRQTPLGILICIPVFILSGFEHSIANMFYFSASACFTCKSLVYILLIIAGNTLGGWFIPLAEKLKKEDIAHAKS